MMDIIDSAIRMEKAGESYSRELMATCGMSAFQKIFALLVEDEARHCRILERLRSKEGPMELDDTVLENAKNVFAQMKEKKQDLDNDSMTLAYRKASELEEKCRKFYVENSERMEDEAAGKLFRQLAEKKKRIYAY